MPLKLTFRLGNRTRSALRYSKEMPAATCAGEGTTIPKARVEASVVSSETIEALVQKVGAPSIAEIEKLIGDLQAARSYLESESERIQQEMTRYAHLNHTASASVKIITESLGQWRNGNNAVRTTPAER